MIFIQKQKLREAFDKLRRKMTQVNNAKSALELFNGYEKKKLKQFL